MSNVKFDDVTAILNHGLDTQREISDLNKLASQRIREGSFDPLMKMIDELLFMAGEMDVRSLVEKEKALEEIHEKLARERIDILKEAELFRGLRQANDQYAQNLSLDIQKAQNGLTNPALLEALDVHSKTNVLKKRIYELSTTKTVAESFSEQLKLVENNYASMAERIWSIMTQLMPLLRGRISMESGKKTFTEAKRVLRGYLGEIEKIEKENK